MQERFLKGKKHTGKKALLVGYLIRLLRSQNLATHKKSNPQLCRDEEIKSEEHVKAMQG